MNTGLVKSRFAVSISLLIGFAVCSISLQSVAFAQTGWHQETLPDLESGSVFHLNDIKALSANQVWIAGGISPTGEAAAIKTLDGTNWALTFRKAGDSNPFASMSEFNRLSVVDANNAWVGSAFGFTAYSTNGGGAWSREASVCTPASVGGPPMHIGAVKAVDSTNVWMAGWISDQQNGSVWHRPYYGNCDDWGYYPYRLEYQTAYSNMFGIDASDASNAWAVYHGNSNGILRTTNGGDSWQSFPSPTGQLYDVAAISANVAWVVGAGGGIAKTTDGGVTWQVQGSGSSATLNKIAAVSSSIAWVVGEGGTVIKTTDGGSTWHLQVSGTTENLTRVTAVDANTAWAVGDNQTLLHVTDGGQNQVLAAPVFEAYVDPPAGSVAGGSIVYLNGASFLPGIQIKFGGIPATSVEYRGSTSLAAHAPAHASGIVNIEARNPDGQTAKLRAAYAFGDTDPIIMMLNPWQTVVNSGAMTLYVYGTALSSSSVINFNGTPLSTAYYDLGNNYAELSAAIPGSSLTSAQTASIAVADGSKISNILPFDINYALTSFSKPSPAPGTRIVSVQSLAGAAQVQFNGLNSDGYVRVGVTPYSPMGYPPAGLSLMRHHAFDVIPSSYLSYTTAQICLPYAHSDLAADGLIEAQLKLLYSPEGSIYPWQDITGSLDTAANVLCGTVSRASLSQYTEFAIAGPAIPRLPASDFDGDGKTDITVKRPDTGIWYTLSSNQPGTYTATQWGLSDDVPVPGDYDGDGKADIAVWRPSTGVWYLLSSASPGTYSATKWGISTDIPIPADYDGDGKADIAVWRPETGVLYVLSNASPDTYSDTQWGMSTDVPVPADYDGDGKTDITVWRPETGTWFILSSSSPGTYTGTQWGIADDIPIPGDSDGDGKTDIAVWRPGTGVWFRLSSASPGTYTGTQWGISTDVPVPSDFDGDGKADIAVWRPSAGIWYVLSSILPGTYTGTQWGASTDLPISSITGILMSK